MTALASTPKVPEAAVEAAVMVQERQSVNSPTVRREMEAILKAAQPHLLSSLLTPEAIEAVAESIFGVSGDGAALAMEQSEDAIKALINAISGGGER